MDCDRSASTNRSCDLLSRKDTEWQIALVIFCEYSDGIRVGRIIPNMDSGVALRLCLSLVVPHRYTAKIAAEVLSVDNEVEPRLDLI